jgi:hypothetical protein
MKRLTFIGMLTVSLALWQFVPGCKTKDGISVDPTRNNLCSETAKVMCHNIFQCCSGLDIERTLGITLSTTESSCRGDLKLACEGENAMVLSAIDNSTIDPELSRIADCLEALITPDDTCFPFASDTTFAADCIDLFTGVQSAGADCVIDQECQPSHTCGSNRKCAALPALGEPCTNVCAAELYCGYNDDMERVCQTRKDAAQGCDSANECAAGLYCARNEEPPVGPGLPDDPMDPVDPIEPLPLPQYGTCTARKVLDEQCSDEEPCEPGLICLDGTCPNGDTCRQDTQCEGICDNTGDPCDQAEDCGLCSETGGPCRFDYNCPDYDVVAGTDTCAYGNCTGSGEGACAGRVCAVSYDTLDFCDIGMSVANRVFGMPQNWMVDPQPGDDDRPVDVNQDWGMEPNNE